MGKVIQFPAAGEAAMDAVIKAERSEAFHEKARELSDFVAGLSLFYEDNDRLVKLMVEQTNIAEHDAMLQGFKMGISLMADESDK